MYTIDAEGLLFFILDNNPVCDYNTLIFMFINEAIANKLKNLVAQAQRVCIALHSNPDADTLGCSLAMAQYLQDQKKYYDLFCQTPLPSLLQTLPLAHKITSDENLIIKTKPDLIIAFDASDLRFSGLEDLLVKLKPRPFLINVDHHKTNTLYGDLNVVYPEAAAATQIVFELLKLWKAATSRDMAECLLFGLLMDTQSFANPATNAGALKTADELIGLGANLKYLRDKFLKTKPVALLQILGQALQDILKNQPLDTALMIIREENFEKAGIAFDEANGISNYLNYLNDSSLAIALKESSDGRIHCSMRSTKPNVDLGRLALVLGGGGHAKAAGFTVHGKIVRMDNEWRII